MTYYYSKLYSLVTFCLILSLAVFASANLVQAQEIKEQFSKPMPEIKIEGQEEFNKTGQEVADTFFDDVTLSFKIKLPESWTEISKRGRAKISVTGGNVLGELRTFYGPPQLDGRSRLEIEAATLTYTMTSEQWMIQHLLAHGYNIQGLNIIDKRKAEALYVFIEDDVSYAARAVAYLNGKYVLFAQHFVPIDRWHTEKVEQAMIMNSFEILKPIDIFVENMLSYNFLDVAEFQFPESWTLRSSPIRSIDRMKVDLLNTSVLNVGYSGPQTRLDGKIYVVASSIYASENLEDEIDKFKKELAEDKIRFGEPIAYVDDIKMSENIDFAETQIFEAIDENNRFREYELWQTIIGAGEYYYLVVLFTPSRDQDYFVWARNTETYKIVLPTFKTNTVE